MLSKLDILADIPEKVWLTESCDYELFQSCKWHNLSNLLDNDENIIENSWNTENFCETLEDFWK